MMTMMMTTTTTIFRIKMKLHYDRQIPKLLNVNIKEKERGLTVLHYFTVDAVPQYLLVSIFLQPST